MGGGYQVLHYTQFLNDLVKKGILELASGGILVLDSTGNHLGTISVPSPATNLAFGPRNSQIYVTAGSTVYRVTNRRRLRIMLDAKLTDRKTGKTIWHEPAMWEQATYDVSVDPLQTQYNHDAALEVAARKLAKKLYLKTVERF